MLSTRPLASTVLAVALLVACGPGDEGPDAAGPEPAPTTTSAPASTAGPGDDGPAALVLGPFDFVAEAVGGGQVVGADYAGSEVVVWFWAPW